MNPTVILCLLAGLPIVILMILKANTTQAFFALCLGYVLVQLVGADVLSFAELFTRHASVSANVMKIGLLVFPAVFTVLFTIRSQRGGKLIFNLLPAIGFGLLLTLMVVPLLSPAIYHSLSSSSAWRELQRSQDLIVGVSALVCMLSLWMQRPHKPKKGHGKH